MAKIYGALGWKHKEEDANEILEFGDALIEAAASGSSPQRPTRRSSVEEQPKVV